MQLLRKWVFGELVGTSGRREYRTRSGSDHARLPGTYVHTWTGQLSFYEAVVDSAAAGNFYGVSFFVRSSWTDLFDWYQISDQPVAWLRILLLGFEPRMKRYSNIHGQTDP